MATHSTAAKYATRHAVSGSNAYDLSRMRYNAGAVPAEIEHEPYRSAPEPATTPARVPSAKPAHKKSRRAYYMLSLTAAAGFAVVAVMMVFVLLAHVRYAAVTNDTVKLQTQLAQLTEQERKLKIAYGNAFEGNKVEQYATHQLGMSKPSETQVGTITSSIQDKAVVADTNRDDGKHSENMFTFLASLVAYFK